MMKVRGLPLQLIFFDFDGVILESVAVKHAAYQQLFADYPEHVAAVMEYHRANLEVSRYVKIEYIIKNILRLPFDPAEAERRALRYRELSLAGVLAASLVAGAREILDWAATRELPCRVVSGIPQAELEEVVVHHGLSCYFASLHGTPPGKKEWFTRLLPELGLAAGNCVMVGDAIGDYRAAAAVGMPFVGRVIPGTVSPFPHDDPLIIAELPNLTGLAALLAANNGGED